MRSAHPVVALLLILGFSSGARAQTKQEESDWYLDTDGTRRDVAPVHRRLNSPIGAPHPLRAALESALGLGIGTTWYWLDDETNRVDWDNPEIRERLNGDAWRFDNNSFAINSIAHPLTGAGFYVLARTNNLGPGWSYVNSFGFSLLWELGIEFKEKFSVNDQLVTPLAGMSIGEFAYRMGRFLNEVNDPTALQNTLRFGLALGESGHRVWDGVAPRAFGAVDANGYGTDMWHRFDVGYSLALGDGTGSPPPVHAHHFSGEFAAMPGYHAVGRAERWFYQLEFSRLDLETSVSTSGGGIAVESEVVIAGHYFHDYERVRERRLDGVSTVVGVNVAHAYRSTTARGFDERYAPLSLPGVATKLWLAEGDLRVEARARANMDFTTMSALAYPNWSLENLEARGKTVLRKQGYFYGFGPSAAAEGTLSFRALQLYGSLLAASVHSTEGIDRSQEEITVDERAHSTVLEWDAGARVRFPLTPLVAHFGYRSARWHSWVEGFTSVAQAEQYELGLSVRF